MCEFVVYVRVCRIFCMDFLFLLYFLSVFCFCMVDKMYVVLLFYCFIVV